MFSKGMESHSKKLVSHILGIQNISTRTQYLGATLTMVSNDHHDIKRIINKMDRKLEGWQGQMLSMAGRRILIQTVTSTIPMYTTPTSQRKLSKLLIAPKETFFGMEDGQNNYAPVAWDQVVKPRKDGGLGIKCLHTKMSVIHALNVWRFLQSPNAWWVQLLKQKYLRSSSFNECEVKSTDSKFWKTLIRNKNTISDNLRWVVGKGDQVDIFHDQWIVGIEVLAKYPTKSGSEQLQDTLHKVKDLIPINGNGNHWNREIIKAIWEDPIADKILDLPLRGTDVRCWMAEPAGKCTVKGLYKYLLHPLPFGPHFPWPTVWKLDVPPKIQLFI